jgi:hypothetical protein
MKSSKAGDAPDVRNSETPIIAEKQTTASAKAVAALMLRSRCLRMPTLAHSLAKF